MRKQIWAMFCIFFILMGFAYAWTPQSHINLRDYYGIYNVSFFNGTEMNLTENITASYFIGNGSSLTNIPGSIDATDSHLYITGTTMYFNTTYIGTNLNVNSSKNATEWDGETSQADLNVNSSGKWDALDSPTDFTTVGTMGTTDYLGDLFNGTLGRFTDAVISLLNSTYIIVTDIVGTTINATSFYQGGNLVLDTSDESSLNVNSSGNATEWDGETSQANLNVNSSNYWDSLDTQTDITSVGTLSSLIVSGFITSSEYNGSMNWTKLKNYPSACSSGYAYTGLGDTMTCSDDWINTGGDKMTGTLDMGGQVLANVSYFNGTQVNASKINTSYIEGWIDADCGAGEYLFGRNTDGSGDCRVDQNTGDSPWDNTSTLIYTPLAVNLTGTFNFSTAEASGALDMNTNNIDAIGSLTNYYSATCGTQAIADIADDGTFSCISVGGTSAWTNDSTMVYTSHAVNITDELNASSLYVSGTSSFIGEATFTADIEASSDINMQDDKYIGIEGAERIEFDSIGRIEIMGAKVGINDTDSSRILEINAGTDAYAVRIDAVGELGYSIYGRFTPATNDIHQIEFRQDSEGDIGTSEILRLRQDATSAGTKIQTWYVSSVEKGYINITGGLQMDGDITGANKYFLIDHPLDPVNKMLKHVAHEGDEMRTVYYGRSQTVGGIATIIRPDWQQALNGYNQAEYTYHLTPIGKWCNLWISKEIENNEFKVSSNTDCEFSWQLTGIRHDAYAEANKMQVEIDKEPADMTISYEEEVIDGKIYEVPIMPGVSSHRKGACIHEEACKDIIPLKLIDYPQEPEKKLITK